MVCVIDSLVLIVEDEALVALDLQDAVIDAGYEAVLAASATEARDLMSLADPAVAVVDMRLRDGVTGPDLAHDLSGRGVPVIVVSGETDIGIAADLPVVGFISKPASPEQVLDQIRSALDCRHTR